jgi:hypothetical protein
MFTTYFPPSLATQEGIAFSTTAIMPAPAETQTATLNKFIDGWKGWTPDGFLASWSEDCAQVTLPFSSGVAPRTRAITEELFPKLMSILTNFEVRVHHKCFTDAQVNLGSLPCTT